MRFCAILLLLAACAPRGLRATGATRYPLSPGPFAPLATEGDRIVDARGRQVILRGLQHHALQDVAYQGREVLDEDYATIAGWGFRVLRVAISWSRIEPLPGMYDDSYVDEIIHVLDLADAAGLVVILEWHQDLWGKCAGPTDGFNNANGAPDWACDPTLSGPFAYIAQFDRMWRNEAGLFDAYIAAFSHVIAAVAEHPAVIGYDLFNEPYGSGTPSFERGTLFPKYREMTARLREAGAGGILFLGAPGFRNETGQMAAEPFTDVDPALVFAPHLYTSWLSLYIFNQSPSAEVKTQDFTNAVAQAETLGLPLWNGEWGINYGLADWRDYAIRHVRLEDKHRIGSAYWAFNQATPGQGDPSVSGATALLNEDRSVREDLLDVLSRPYPRQTPGVLTSLEYDLKTHALDVAFEANATLDALILYAPARHLTDDRCLVVSGGDARYDFDAANELVLVSFDRPGPKKVALKPCR